MNKTIIAVGVGVVLAVVIPLTVVFNGATLKPGMVIKAGSSVTIKWDKNAISSPQVQLNVIREVKTNPHTYILVRTITKSTANTGSSRRVISLKDVGDNTYVEVGCTYVPHECHAYPLIGPFKVIK